MSAAEADSAPAFNVASAQRLPGYLGVVVDSASRGRVEAHLDIKVHHLAPNEFLHAATVIALADTACGAGCFASLPDGASGFTTIELKSNFLGTAREGTMTCRAELVHGGRTTQVWDATVVDGASQRTIALFRCTQMILWPRPAPAGT